MQTVETLDTATRTFNCSVVFVDLVGYAKKTVTEQIAARGAFNALLAEALAPVPVEARIILDTDHGAAMSFLDAPEDALYAGLKLRQLVVDGMAGNAAFACPNARIGINLGPVQIGQDAVGTTSIVGDGLDSAEQIMAFALPGQITVSKSFHDKVAKLSADYAGLFRYEGSRTDKRVREHEIYQLGWSDEALRRALDSIEARGTPDAAALSLAASVPLAASTNASASPPVAAPVDDAAVPKPQTEPLHGLIDFLEDRVKVAFAAALLGAVIVAQGILLYMKRAPAVPPAPHIAGQAPAATVEAPASPAPKSAAEPSAPAAVAPQTVAAQEVPRQEAATPPKQDAALPPRQDTPALPKQDTAALPKQSAAIPPKQDVAVSPKQDAAVSPRPEPAPPLKPAAAAPDQPAKPAPRKAAPEAAKPAPRKSDAEPAKPAPRKAETSKDAKPVAPAATPSPARQEGSAMPAGAQPKSNSSTDSALVPLVRTSVDFPKEALREGISSGAVKARLAIDSTGNVTQVDILESRPARVFDRAVKAALAKWKFAPGADRRAYEVEIEFKK